MMKMKLAIISGFLLITLFTACDGNTGKTAAGTGSAEDSVPKPDMHTAQTSVDWYGTYNGILPCADCEGIETSLTLNKDLTYVLTLKYKGKKGTGINPETFKNKFGWEQDGSTIALDGLEKAGMNNRYFVSEGYVLALDGNGKKPEGNTADLYKLVKQ